MGAVGKWHYGGDADGVLPCAASPPVAPICQKEMTMTLVPLINATMPIPLHALAAILALVIGAAQLWLAKGTARHRQLGYVWVGLMAFVAISGFFIYETRLFGVFSLIHLLSVLVLVTLWRAVRMARAGKIRAHRRAMILLFWLALVLTGLFTFAPGRIMHQVVTGF
jgi:uncharacterized membrane protein|tara:strand:+ start:62 stop:562 length:501 start_codon:yes stop_codon:yes gene_type:complete